MQEETDSGAHSGAVSIDQTAISELKENWNESEINGVARFLNTDIALELKCNYNYIDPWDYICEGYRTFTLLDAKLWLLAVTVWVKA